MKLLDLLSLGYTTKVTPGDDGLDPDGKSYIYHVEIVAPDGSAHYGEYSHDVEETLTNWHEEEWGD